MHCVVIEGDDNKELACFDQDLQRQDVSGMTKSDVFVFGVS